MRARRINGMKWHNSWLSNLIQTVEDHVYSEPYLVRRIAGKKATPGATWQHIERVRVSPTSAYERTTYRLIEVRVIGYYETAAETRLHADDRVSDASA